MNNLNIIDYNYRINNKLITKFLYLFQEYLMKIMLMLLERENSLNWEEQEEVLQL